MPAAEFHRLVEIDNRGHAFLERAHGIEQIRHQQPIHDKPGAVAGAHRGLPHASREGQCIRVNLLVRGDGANHLHQLHDRHRIEKMQPDKTVWPPRGHRHLGDGKRRGITRINRRRRAKRIERAKQLFLRRQLLDDRFDNQIALAKSSRRVVPSKPAARAIAFCRAESPLYRPCRARFFSMLFRPFSSSGSETSRTTTGTPACATVCAMPDPISPQPTTPTVSMPKNSSPPACGEAHSN